ncbi:MAG: Oligopeptide/dipeptide ABC transporter, ATPase subunit [Atribacteria bacterium 34_128]|nr:MAG: Oligopeptide/dipeptide ABC transporter, ATPase subunit [Atribacteria bacterium 34_128]HBY57724.1 peptide ABC transporter ATP-binding protein [Candidatus Atribacteria bacterium]
MMVPLLEVKDLYVQFSVFEGELKVLNGVNLKINEGEKIGLVGEAGCGKTTTMKSILRVLPTPVARISKGEIIYKGKNILNMKPSEIQNIRRGEITAIFQDPLTSLNPVFTIGQQLGDVIKYASRYQDHLDKKEIFSKSVAALKETGMPDPERILNNYPVQLSGGMRQRVCISEALSTNHNLIIADEPTTSLDVTIQDQILRLLSKLVEKKKMSIILITHSLGVVRELTDRVYVMYAGNIVETAQTTTLFSNPLHPYTRGLMNAIPRLTGERIFEGIEGRIPNYLYPPTGCRFHPRCKYSTKECQEIFPLMYDTGNNHEVACFLYKEELN